MRPYTLVLALMVCLIKGIAVKVKVCFVVRYGSDSTMFDGGILFFPCTKVMYEDDCAGMCVVVGVRVLCVCVCTVIKKCTVCL